MNVSNVHTYGFLPFQTKAAFQKFSLDIEPAMRMKVSN